MKIVTGCFGVALRTGEVGAIAHQANCFNTMKSGAAATVRRMFPEAIQADLETIRGHRDKLGDLSIGLTPYGPVFNLYGQYNFGYDGRQYTDYQALALALYKMRGNLLDMGIDKVGMVKLGCGLAGGDWEIVGNLIQRVFKDTDIQVNVYVKE